LLILTTYGCDALRVLIISDTHDNLGNVDYLIRNVIPKEKPQLIVHLGDFTSPFTLLRLKKSGIPIIGVLGNNDGDVSMLREIEHRVAPQPVETNLGGFSTFLMHGFKDAALTEKIATAIALSGYYQLVLFGHTHRYKIEQKGRTLLVNPGALSGYLAEDATYAVLDTTSRNVKVKKLRAMNILVEGKVL